MITSLRLGAAVIYHLCIQFLLYFFKLLNRVVPAASSESPYAEASYQIIWVTSAGLGIVQSISIAVHYGLNCSEFDSR